MKKKKIKQSLIVSLTIFTLLLTIFRITPTFSLAQTPTNEPKYKTELTNLVDNILRFFSNIRTTTDNPNNTVTPDPDIHNPDPNQTGTPEVTIGPIPPPSASKLTKILYWANFLNLKLIVSSIVWPPWEYFHKMAERFTNEGYTSIAGAATSEGNIYWCTYLVIDAFNLSGLKGLSAANHSAVLNMIPFFMNTPGYTFIPYSVAFSSYNPPRYRVTTVQERKNSLSKVKPGCAVFFQSEAGLHRRNHTAIIKEIRLDSNFYGHLKTIDANSMVRIAHYPIEDGIIKETLYVPDSLRGFGCPI